jgi:ADP-ribosyl-[dinitrogen reductase] hydrolase
VLDRERFRGCLIGLAVGDALGTTLEFTMPGAFTLIDDMIGGGPFHLQPGQWTDDTSMALCLADSLLERQSFDPHDQLERYVRWWRDGYLSSTGTCFDIGGTVRAALARFERTREPYCGSTDSSTAGNGSLMRLAPVPMFYAGDPQTAIERSGDSSRTTHATRAAVDACRYFGGLLAAALNGASKEELLSERFAPIAGYWLRQPLHSAIDEVAGGSFIRKHPPEIRGNGYVVNTLEAALWAFYRSTSFEDGALLAVNLGEDADTTGAVFGQIAGAFYGEANIPARWQVKLAQRELIESMADRLYTLAQRSEAAPLP